MTRKSRRLVVIAACGAVLALALGLILSAMSGSIVFFRSPSEVAAQAVQPGVRFRIGGLVKDGSLQRGADQRVAFAVTDTAATVEVAYQGLLPDLFREGQGVVAEGTLDPTGVFRADTVLAKHDERYMPREVADALKAQGRWQEGEGKSPPAQAAAPRESAAGMPATLGPRSER
ncbi:MULTISPECIES: cytochrome c maturation protein CcmE [Methylobacterium]|uniref:Cytochrome c-type biogenesis protein CcmE n=1 Tax=Methylobacterium jeotgali TaxID=381630 RepID=A0ABQ4SQT8_9HYPH|nr:MULTISPECIES: cytochrome c maturation protein CcmE [Methylobacterium]PIU07446.1 MAG: cytochrome c maturation protein CcmE [Methylobacterium sp. CG09_land_8_20_14_0_10_71_15]PIU13982.1 MAG: cytochrome c maturation protein CcmE [Methylobacterium sp. CG08_land_8_20_14_0_20_71_15]GBU17318.1 cytochrome c-type biogenesis protein CcmE [Methylobacterium sp.]GJE05512.1 Cytochrome c-type biogenesis protein CcmE [Methylobacterium jeotgali]